MTIDGAWLTNLIRDRFHNENGTITDARETLKSTGVPDGILDEVTQGILEGSLKFENLPNGQMSIVPDNTPLPTMLQVAEKTKQQLALEQLETRMFSDPLPFCDPWSTDLWTGYIQMMLNERRNPTKDQNPYYDPIELLTMPPIKYLRFLIQEKTHYDETDATIGGTWTLDEPELLLECGFADASSNDSNAKAWQKLFEKTYNRPELKERHIKYLESIARDRNLIVEINENDLSQSYMHPYTKPEQTLHLPSKEKMPTPTIPQQWSGLISPDGSFYPATFAHHETIAQRIIDANHITQLNKEDALETLLRNNWVICRTLPYYPYVRQPMIPLMISTAQQETLTSTENLPDFKD